MSKGLSPLLLLGGAAAFYFLGKKRGAVEAPAPGPSPDQLDDWGQPSSWQIAYQGGPETSRGNAIRLYKLPDGSYMMKVWIKGSLITGGPYADYEEGTAAASSLEQDAWETLGD